ncbi:hypothetical protein HU200_001320 [Digitaria exilis]|uniref:F-box domain-containing protein n=1 Tax=Digitaria exilis TaxID=1010633 RepID=A0A835KUZ7_9POAL|nr:hypothetical protein HU200_001320 [Digitaria exilis]
MTPNTLPPPAKRRQSAASDPAVPEDLRLTEILVRLPVRSLKRFRSVCQSWRAAIDDDPTFVHRHLELSTYRTPPSVLDIPCEPRLEEHWGVARSKEMEFRRIRHDKTTTVSAELMHAMAWPANRFTAVTEPIHCDGMVLVPTVSDELFICNPATREFVELPPGTPSVVKPSPVAFGFDHCSNTYKVARIFYRELEVVVGDDSDDLERLVGPGHEVLTLGDDGSSWSWEPTEDPPYYVAQRKPMCTWDAFYWTGAAAALSDSGDLSLPPTGLLRFSLRDKAFTLLPNPPCNFSSRSPDGDVILGEHDKFTELHGNLCFAHVFADMAVDLWLADDVASPEWSPAWRIELPRPIAHSVVPLAVVDDDGDDGGLLLCVDRRVLYKYSVRSGAVEQVVDLQRAPDLYGRRPPLPLLLVHHAVPYVESLVSICRPNY